jgi:hypothetical protein
MRRALALASALVVIVAPGCMRHDVVEFVQEAPPGSSSSSSGGGAVESDGGTVTGPLPTLGGDGGSSSGVAPGDCSDASKLVYVVSRENDLYSIAPQTMTTTRIGALACPAGQGAFPFSMAVDRGGTAWVLYSDGNLFQASTANAACKATSFVPNQAGFSLFGMGFVSDAQGASTETLYVSENVNGNGLGKIDTSTLTLTASGKYTGTLAGQKAELTGTGDATLFGFFLTSPAQIAQIGANGGIDSTQPLPSVVVGTDWAFAFWGGDFFMFTGNSTDPKQNGSAVTRYSPSDGSVTVVSTGLGFFVTGAGVSTCAPTTTPAPK